MIDFSPELEARHASLGDALADALIARERREVFSVHAEVRIAAWAGALLIAAAAGLFVKEHFELFDKRLIAVALGVAAAVCYAWAWRLRERSVVSDYLVLLGALLVSADLGFIEQQFDLLGPAGSRHFLLLAIVHAFTAYVFDSRLVLSLSIAALAAWMGLERRQVFETSAHLAPRAFACAAVLLMWRATDRFYRPATTFSRTFEHFAANIALWGSFALCDEAPLGACITTVVIAALIVAWGFRTHVESFVLYAFVYAVIAVDVYLFSLRADVALVVFVSTLIAVPALVVIHRWFRRNEP